MNKCERSRGLEDTNNEFLKITLTSLKFCNNTLSTRLVFKANSVPPLLTGVDGDYCLPFQPSPPPTSLSSVVTLLPTTGPPPHRRWGKEDRRRITLFLHCECFFLNLFFFFFNCHSTLKCGRVIIVSRFILCCCTIFLGCCTIPCFSDFTIWCCWHNFHCYGLFELVFGLSI